MTQTSRFFDSVAGDRLYNSEEFSEYFEVLVDTGLIVGALNQLNPTVTGTNMIVTVDTGNSFINGRFYENDSSLNNTFDTETLGNDRIDLLVLRLDLNVGARIIDFQIVKGIPSPSPAAPTVTRDSTIHELALAEIFITGGQSFIQVGDLTDLREITTQASFFFPSASSKVLPSIDQQAVDDNTQRVAKYGTTTGSANGYLLTVNDVTSYFDGLLINIKANFTNTGASTINVNSLGAKNIFFKGSALPSGYISNGEQYSLIYDGTQFNLKSQPKIINADFLSGAALSVGNPHTTPSPSVAKFVGTSRIMEVGKIIDFNFDSLTVDFSVRFTCSSENNLNLDGGTLTLADKLIANTGISSSDDIDLNNNDLIDTNIIKFDSGIWLRSNAGLLEQSDDNGFIWKVVGGVNNVQRGKYTASITAGSFADVVITSVDTTKTMINLLNSYSASSSTGTSTNINLQLINATTLRINNDSSISNTNISWEVIEYN